MAKDKKKKKKDKKKKGDYDIQFESNLSQTLGSSSNRVEAGQSTVSTFVPPAEPSQETVEPQATIQQGITLGQVVDRSNDRLFIGTDYREVFSWQYERSWAEILSDLEHWHYMPFTLGLELELILAYSDGSYPDGTEMVHTMKEAVKEVIKIMDRYLYEGISNLPPVPSYIVQKVLARPYFREDKEKGGVMVIRYKLPEEQGKDYVDVDSFARDGNATAVTYILELVTPPCEYVEELAFWASTLFQLAKMTLPKDIHIIASGINPAAKEYMRGLTQATHVHIGGFRDDREKAQVYSMIRNFIPHLIALSVNSPIFNNKPTDTVKIINNRVTAPNCIRSLRLHYNQSMLSSNEPNTFLPYLTTADQSGAELFLRTIQKASLEDGRMQDLTPFSRQTTIEFRPMDAQLSICRNIGLAILIQALAYKARKLLERGTWVPDAGSETISRNRKGAYERGLISLFKPYNLDRARLAQYDPDFAEQYLGPENAPNRYMTHAVQRMFLYLKPELLELDYLYTPFLKPLLMSVFGEISYALAPMTEAEYQLSLYDYKVKAGEEPNVLRDLIYFTLEYSKDPISHPLTGNLTLPKELYS
ncbi:MAG: glutamate-cysteine ligase family protein [Promethearchaeota archaeon]